MDIDEEEKHPEIVNSIINKEEQPKLNYPTVNLKSKTSSNIWVFHGHGDRCEIGDEYLTLNEGQTVIMLKHDATGRR